MVGSAKDKLESPTATLSQPPPLCDIALAQRTAAAERLGENEPMAVGLPKSGQRSSVDGCCWCGVSDRERKENRLSSLSLGTPSTTVTVPLDEEETAERSEKSSASSVLKVSLVL